MLELEKPKKRSSFRLLLGREFYIARRKYQWLSQRKDWASLQPDQGFEHSCFEHRSIVRRPLRDVDMYLQDNKRVNLELALAHLNGLLLRPGQSFSFWRQVGRPTAKRGFLEGLVLKSGQIEKDIGGGLCQLGNLMFWMMAHSPLSIIERHRHGFDVFPDVNRTIPFGAGATLAYNYIDLQGHNPTDRTFQWHLWLDKTHLNGRLSAQHAVGETYRVEERGHEMKQQAWGGYSRHNEIWRITEKNGQRLREQRLAKNDAVMMYNPFLESN